MKKVHLKLGAILGDNIIYHDISTTCIPLERRIKENEYPYEKEERDKKYLESRKNNKSLGVFE